jgi:enterochelin esterase-like enzyme
LREQFRRLRTRPLAAAALVLAVSAFVGVGTVGAYRYGRGYWLYRGFPPPKDPAWVGVSGTTQRISVISPALGGRSQEVYVYLPPGYDSHPNKRYPVFYLLHGFPGRPTAFLLTVRAGVVEDVLVAKRFAGPMILVMPFGSTGSFTDKEWANGVGKAAGWETFVARDLVHAIDSRYRTIPTGAGRALGGLSEGGYGALNIGLHHPGEFRVLESWSGYERADDLKEIFDHRSALLARNSPLDELSAAAPALRRANTYVWFYSGTDDRRWVNRQNSEFADELQQVGIRHRFLLFRGGHTWSIWRGKAWLAYTVAARRLTHA